MAVQFKDGVVIGADSRTTTGSYIVSVVQGIKRSKMTIAWDRQIVSLTN